MQIIGTRAISESDPIIYKDDIMDPIEFDDGHMYDLIGFIICFIGIIAMFVLAFVPLHL